MHRLLFGARENSVVQFAYSVPDIHEGMRNYGTMLGIGPWFVTEPFVPLQGRYRNTKAESQFRLAFAFCGNVMIELIAQENNAPSVIKEVVEKRGGHGFHHWGIGVTDFERSCLEMEEKGFQAVFTDVSPQGVRVAYYDTFDLMNGMVEILQMTDESQALFASMKAAADEWDGTTHIVHQLG